MTRLHATAVQSRGLGASGPGAIAALATGLTLVAAGCLVPPNPSGGMAPSVRSVVRDEPPIPAILVSQVGYATRLPKVAVVRSTLTTPLDWRLLDGAGAVVATGRTTPFGPDRASGDAVHIIDFSPVRRTGEGFRLQLAAARDSDLAAEPSHPFAIGPEVFHTLAQDALGFFYQNRSGIEIAMPYAREAQWARPAGHLSDHDVGCVARAACGYRLDVAGGWYDAGDHGKYVVNGGIALWTLLDLHERFQHRVGTVAPFADGTLRIPEQHNGVPDLLDEARWEMEWMMRMQVPEGQPLAGMAHHKVHDRAWTTLALAPHADTQPRFLHPPSTAATLNLAATAAQAARIWKTIDPAFAARCLAAARRAFAAALAHPALYAPGGQTVGGGPYEDSDVTDEFYWAAAELFITTGEAAFHERLSTSPHFGVVPSELGAPGRPEQASAMTWQRVQALGTLSLAVVPNGLAEAERARVRDAVIAAADTFVAAIASEGYRTPFKAGPKGYPWGSSSDVANNLIVIALAGDLTRDARYPRAVAVGIGYLLGRNPLDRCYVSGYGARPLRNPHHRFWAHQFNYRFPPPPPGVLAGGPNSGLQDPTIRSLGPRMLHCAPETCYVDHIESWSTNEVAINWNAPLAWIVSYLDFIARDPTFE